MSTTLVPRVSWIRPAMMALIALLICAGVYAITASSHDAQLVLLRQQSDRIAEENHTYCEKWGFPAGTEKYRACVSDLGDIRKREAGRILDEDLGYPGLL